MKIEHILNFKHYHHILHAMFETSDWNMEKRPGWYIFRNTLVRNTPEGEKEPFTGRAIYISDSLDEFIFHALTWQHGTNGTFVGKTIEEMYQNYLDLNYAKDEQEINL